MRPGPLFLSCLTRAAPPFVLTTSCSLSCPQHAPLLPSSTTPAASPGSPLVLEMHRSSPGPPGHQHESLVPSYKTRLLCRARSFSVVLRAVQRLAPVDHGGFARLWQRQVIVQLTRSSRHRPGPALFAAAPDSEPVPLKHCLAAAPVGGWVASTVTEGRRRCRCQGTLSGTTRPQRISRWVDESTLLLGAVSFV